MSENELTDIVAILVGHKIVCMTFAMLYYPFGIATLFSFSQQLAILMYFLLRMCGCSGG